MFCELFGYSKQAYYKQCAQHRALSLRSIQAKDLETWYWAFAKKCPGWAPENSIIC